MARVVYGNIAEQIEKAFLSGLDSGTLIVMPDAVAIRRARRYLLERHETVDASIFTTFEDLAADIVLSATGIKPVVVPEVVREVVSGQICSEIAAEEQRWRILSGDFPKALLEEFEAVWPNILASGRGPRGALEGAGLSLWDSERMRLLSRFSEFYYGHMEGLRDSGYCDRELLALRASEHADALGRMGIRRILVCGIVFADACLLKLLEAISARVELTFVYEAADRSRDSVRVVMSRMSLTEIVDETPAGNRSNGDRSIFGAPDRRREITEVARRIRLEMAESGDPPHTFAVVAKSIRDYEKQLRDIFAEYSIPITEGGRKRYSNLRLFTYMMRTLDLLGGAVEKNKICRLLEHDFYPAPAALVKMVLEETAHLPERFDSAYEMGKFATVPAPGGLTLPEWLSGMRRRADAVSDLRGWIELALEIIKGAAKSGLGEGELRGNREFISGIKDLSAVSIASTSKPAAVVTLSHFRSLMRDYAADNSYMEEEGSYGGVLFTDAGLIYTARFRHLFAMGMSEDTFPSKMHGGVFVSQAMVEAICEGGPPARILPSMMECIERHDFEEMTSSAPSVTFSYIYSDERGRRLLPSAFVLEALGGPSGSRGLIDTMDEWNLKFSSFYPEDGTPLTKREGELMAAAGLQQYIPERMPSEKLPGEYAHLGEIVERRRIVLADPLEWRFESGAIDPLTGGKPLSATDLTEYVKCPFRYVATRLIRANRVLPKLNPMERGTQMHAILKRFYDGYGLGFLRTRTADEIRTALWKCADGYFEEIYGSGRLGLRFELHLKDVREALFEFVEADAVSESSMSGSILGLEMTFGYNGQKKFVIGEHSFRGAIDRVETISASGKEVLLYDYKSGSPSNLTKKYFRAGSETLDYGIPLYALYLNDAEGMSIAAALYYSLRKKEGDSDRAGFVRSRTLAELPMVRAGRRACFDIRDEAGAEGILDRYREEVREIAGKISAGFFPVTPRKGECTGCSYSSLCRYRRGRG